MNALRRVRAGTRRLHRQLDRESSLARLASSDCSLAEYRAALLPLSRAYARVDRALVAGDAYRPLELAPYRARSPLIGAALAALSEHRRPPMQPVAVDAIESTAAYLGCRYVVDGAQFGHAVIRRALERSAMAAALPVSALSFWRARFLAPEDWRALCRQLQTMPTRMEAAVATISARRVFEMFKRCFAQAAGEAGG